MVSPPPSGLLPFNFSLSLLKTRLTLEEYSPVLLNVLRPPPQGCAPRRGHIAGGSGERKRGNVATR